MKPVYEMSLAAESDLREIIRYTACQWGVEQVRHYTKALEKCTCALVTGNTRYKELNEIRSGLRMVHCKHHFIFCLLRPDRNALIIAIFHEKMNLMTRLKQRLTV